MHHVGSATRHVTDIYPERLRPHERDSVVLVIDGFGDPGNDMWRTQDAWRLGGCVNALSERAIG